MLEANVYFAPSAFEAGFVSDAHGEDEITQTLKKAEQVFGSLMA
jgi:glutamate-1-semialdehyde 2,1-aminomutase